MTQKTYKANKALSLTVQLGNGTSAYIQFAPQVDGSSIFITTDTTLQTQLENHLKYGKLFTLDSTETVANAYTYPKVSYSDKEESQGGVVMFTSQNLTEQEKQQARQNIGAATEPAELENVLRYSSQVLTDLQKQQARSNINADEYAEVITDEEMDAVLSE